MRLKAPRMPIPPRMEASPKPKAALELSSPVCGSWSWAYADSLILIVLAGSAVLTALGALTGALTSFSAGAFADFAGFSGRPSTLPVAVVSPGVMVWSYGTAVSLVGSFGVTGSPGLPFFGVQHGTEYLSLSQPTTVPSSRIYQILSKFPRRLCTMLTLIHSVIKVA